jgi:hypothetical protein
MAKKTKTTSAETWKKRYQVGVRNQERQFRKFADWYDLMYAHVNTSQYALWRSKVFIPLIPAKAWAMIAKMQALKPGFEVGLYGEALLDPDAQMRAEKAQWKLEHDWDNPLFDEPMSDKLFSPLVDAVVTGTGIGKIPWTLTNATRYEKYQDEATGELDVTRDVKIEHTTGYNDLIPQDIFGVFIAPGSKNLYSAPWVVLEDSATLDQLEGENEAAGFEINKNLKDLDDLKSDNDDFKEEKRSRMTLVGDDDDKDSDDTVGSFKRLECYEKKLGRIYRSVYIVGSGPKGEDTFVELSTGPLPYWHSKYPLVSFYVKKRPHHFWGQGVFEDTERLQSAFNDIFNHYMDNYNLALDGMLMKQEDDEHTFIVQPGGEYIYKNDPPQQFKFPEPDQAMFQGIMAMIETQVEESTISRYATGTPNSSQDKTHGTASGIAKLTEMAGDKIGFMKGAFSNSIREIGRQWLSNNQQFLDDDFTLMGQVENRPGPVTISPADMQGQMVLRINDASMEPISKEEELAKFQAYMQQTIQMQQASIQQAQLTGGATQPMFLDFGSLFQDLSQKMGYANFDKILLKNDDIMGQGNQQQPPPDSKNGSFTLDDLYGSEASQVLLRDGVQPDPQRQGQVPAAVTANAPAGPPEVDPGALMSHALEMRKQAFTEHQAKEDTSLRAQDQAYTQAKGAAEFEHMKKQPPATTTSTAKTGARK